MASLGKIDGQVEPEQSGGTNWAKLAFLWGLCVLLSSFGPFFLFAPAPAAFAFLINGYKRAGIVGGAIFGFLLAIGLTGWPAMMNAMSFLVAGLYGAVIAFIVFKGEHPALGLMKRGGTFVGLLFVLGLAVVGFSDLGPGERLEGQISVVLDQIKNNKEYSKLVSQGGEDARMLQELIANPKALASKIMGWAPAALFVSLFLSLWCGLLLVLRNSLAWRSKTDYPFETKDLLAFKAPGFFVWPLIIGLTLAAGGDVVFTGDDGKTAMTVGMNILYCLGVFYFFQGFGIFSDFLDHLRMGGLFRSLLSITVLVFAWRVLVILGVFDNWINFRKFLIAKSEGEQS